jgi:CheY-like chemotaxis protein
MIRILHVDDSINDLELTKINLHRCAKEIEIEWVESGKEALDRLSETVFDCILCDYQMPGFNGLDLLKALREAGRPHDSILILFLANDLHTDGAAAVLVFRTNTNEFYVCITQNSRIPDNKPLIINNLIFSLQGRCEIRWNEQLFVRGSW